MLLCYCFNRCYCVTVSIDVIVSSFQSMLLCRCSNRCFCCRCSNRCCCVVVSIDVAVLSLLSFSAYYLNSSCAEFCCVCCFSLSSQTSEFSNSSDSAAAVRSTTSQLLPSLTTTQPILLSCTHIHIQKYIYISC